MQPEKQEISLYPKRLGSELDIPLAVLSKQPENPTDPEVLAQVRELDAILTRGTGITIDESGQVRQGSPDGIRGLEHLIRVENRVYEFFIEYFTTDEGRAGLRDAFPDAPDLNTGRDLLDFLSTTNLLRQENGETTPDIVAKLKQLSGDSIRFAEKKLRTSFETKSRIEFSDIPDRIHFVEDPLKLLRTLKELRKYKDLLREAQALLSGTDSEIDFLLSLHRSRINVMLAGQYSTILTLVDQLLPDDTRRGAVITEIQSLMRGAVAEDGSILPTEKRNIRISRMDKFVNGAGTLQEDGNFGFTSDEVMQLLSDLDMEVEKADSGEDVRTPLLPPEARNVTVSADTFHSWVETSLREFGILSSHQFTEDDFTREGPALDGKWQVAIYPDVQNLSVDKVKRLVKIPITFNRKLYLKSGGGAIQILDHELAHVVQFSNAIKLNMPILDVVGTGRTSPQHEAGAIMWESAATLEYFGEDRPTNPHFLRAALVRSQGGTYADCVMAFFNSMMKINPNQDKSVAAELSINRARRLFRNGGDLRDRSRVVFDSQPLAYIEQELFMRAAKSHNMTHLALCGNVDIYSLAAMHSRGWIDTSKLTFPSNRPSQLLKESILQLCRDNGIAV